MTRFSLSPARLMAGLEVLLLVGCVRPGTLKRFTPDTWSSVDISGVPAVADEGQGGFMARVSRARLKDTALVDREALSTPRPAFAEWRHFGSHLLLQDGFIYTTAGDRAQAPATDNGKALRLTEDGGVPPDNPFLNVPGALPEIYSYGHRIRLDPE